MHKHLQAFKSQAKLLLTGEYLVLRGAKALALPLTFTQTLEIEALEAAGHSNISWFAMKQNGLWFKSSFELPSLDIIATDDKRKSAKLQLILLTLKQLNPNIFNENSSYKIITRLDFNPEWGLGTSSTLIANLAKWAKVDPYTLLQFSIGGSGYDIACANAKAPITYQLVQLKPKVQHSNFNPSFHDKLFFVYRGLKKDSASGIKSFSQISQEKNIGPFVEKISIISNQVEACTCFDEFCDLMNRHENIISNILNQPVIKTSFPDFKGHIKSLGAWGGDFMLAMSNEDSSYVKNYFAQHGLHTIFAYNEIVH